MKTKIGIAASLLALGGCSLFQAVGRTVGDDFAAATKNKEQDRAFCDNLNIEEGRAWSDDRSSVRDMDRADEIGLVFKRAEACRRWYASLAGIVVASDGAGSTLTSTGGIGLIATGGSTAAMGPLFSTLSIAPTVVREVTRLEPQGALAHQAAEATTLAECQLVRVREGLFDLLLERQPLIDAIEEARGKRALLRGSVAELAKSLLPKLPADPAPANPPGGNQPVATAAAPQEPPTFAELVAKNAELRDMVQLARRYDELISAGEELLTQIDLRTGYMPPDRQAGDPDAIMALIKNSEPAAVAAIVRSAKTDIALDLLVEASPSDVAALFGESTTQLGDYIAQQKSSKIIRQIADTPDDELRDLFADAGNAADALAAEAGAFEIKSLLDGGTDKALAALLQNANAAKAAQLVQGATPEKAFELIKGVKSRTEVAKLILGADPDLNALKDAMDRIDKRLAVELNTKVDSINLIWMQNFRQLTPKPDASLRSVLAAPFSITAKIIAGEETAPGNAEEVAKAAYDFSASYGAHGVEAYSTPTILVTVDKALVHPDRWDAIDTSLDNMRGLSSAMAKANSVLNEVALVDSQSAAGFCRVSPAKGAGTVPDAPAPTQAPNQQGPVLVRVSN